jgi:hypothetical protein
MSNERGLAPMRDVDVETLRRLWRAYLPVRAIARDLGRTPKQVEAMARELGLAHRHPAAVEHAGRLRVIAAAVRRAREASEELFPLAMSARRAAGLAASHGVAWSGRRGDLSVLNAALEGAGQRPVYVPFRELRP